MDSEMARIQRLNDYLRANLGRRHNAARLATECGLSRVYVADRISVVKRLGIEAWAVAVMVPPRLRGGPWVPPERERAAPSLTDDEREARLRAYLASTPRHERPSSRQIARDMGLSPVCVREIIRQVEPKGQWDHDTIQRPQGR